MGGGGAAAPSSPGSGVSVGRGNGDEIAGKHLLLKALASNNFDERG